MRLEQFQYLREIAQTGSMNRTGGNLHVSQQAISTAVRLLEEELGAALLVRTSKGVQLTAAGQKALAAAEDIFERITQLKEELQEEAAAPEKLVLMVHAGMLRGQMAGMVPQLYKEFAEYAIKILPCQIHEMIEAICLGEADLGLTYILEEGLKLLAQSELSFKRLGTYYFGVFISCRSPLAQHTKLSLQEVVARYPIMIFEEINSENNMVQSVLRQKNLQDQARYLAVSDEIFAQMIEADMAAGIAFQNKQDKLVEQKHQNGVFLPLTEQIPVYSGYITTKEKKDALLTRRFSALLKRKP